MIVIDVVSDTVCPWCYIGKRRLERAMTARPNYAFRIDWRPFQLNPDLPADGMDRARYLALKFGGRDRAGQIYDRVRDAGSGEAIPFDFEAIRSQPNTFDSHRLIRWAGELDVQDVLVEDLFQRYFLKGENIGEPAVLLEAADAAGMDRELVAGRRGRRSGSPGGADREAYRRHRCSVLHRRGQARRLWRAGTRRAGQHVRSGDGRGPRARSRRRGRGRRRLSHAREADQQIARAPKPRIRRLPLSAEDQAMVGAQLCRAGL